VPDAAGLAWAMVQRFMQDESGVTLRDDQSYLLEARLGGVSRSFSFPDTPAFVRAACAPGATAPHRRALIDAMTTHETLFFRDAPFWERMEQTVLPSLSATGRPIRIWSAACSSGQEPYSLVMMLEESFPELVKRTEILATDVAADTVDRARNGVFTTLEVNRGLNARRMVRHFDSVAGGFQFKATLRDRIRFSVHNLVAPGLDPSDCDIVLCRNVLIYFEDERRRQVITRLRRAARPDGLIGVGSTETLSLRSLGPGWYENAEKEWR